MKKAIVIIASILALAVLGGVGTLALLTRQSGQVENAFTLATFSGHIDEDFDGSVKSAVEVQNTSNIDAYVRVNIVAYWAKADGSVYPGNPAVGFTVGAGWQQVGSYYYYQGAVKPGQSTTNLLGSPIASVACPEAGYTMYVDVLAQGVHTRTGLVESTWHMSWNGTSWTAA